MGNGEASPSTVLTRSQQPLGHFRTDFFGKLVTYVPKMYQSLNTIRCVLQKLIFSPHRMGNGEWGIPHRFDLSMAHNQK